MKITIEVSFDGETPVVTARAQATPERDASDAGRAPDQAAAPALAAAGTVVALADAGAPAAPPFDAPAGVLAADHPAADATGPATEAIDAGAAPQFK